MNVRIREQNLPGIGRSYELSVGDGRRLTIVVQRDGRREISIREDMADGPAAVVSLEHDHAVAVAALLTGARFSIEPDHTQVPRSGNVAVETVTLTERSPAVGLPARDVPLLAGVDAAILAVIRDDTPQLVEEDAGEPCRVGDRVVVAARRDRLLDVIRELVG